MAKRKAVPRTTRQQTEWAGTAEEWKRRAGPHQVTLGSGQRVTFKILSLRTLVDLDALPGDLNEAVTLHIANLDRGGLGTVIAEHTAKGISDPAEAERARELLRDLGRLTRHLVVESLVEPALTVDELDEIPEADLEELMLLCTGRKAFDSMGVRIGVEPINTLARFRDRHECPPDCAACAQILDDLSSLHLDAV